MIKHIQYYPSPFERDVNLSLMKKEADKPLLEFVIDSWKSLQILEGIEFLGYEYTEKMSEFDINKLVFKREKGKPKSKRFPHKYMEDNRVGKLTVYLKLSTFETDFKTGKKIKRVKEIKKNMLIPIQDEDGFFFVKGKHYYLIMQLVEKSTYTTNNGTIFKSLMPFAMKRKIIDCEDMNGNVYDLPYYTIDLFKKEYPIMLVYASKGMNDAIQFALDAFPYFVMEFTKTYDKEDSKHIYFGISSKLFLKVRKELFDEFVYIRSVVGGIMEICSNRLTFDKLDDETIWIKKMSQSNLEKGKNLLSSLQRLLDETAKKLLRVDIYNKLDVLSVIRWMSEEFNENRAKDNMNLANKRLRCNEVISSLLTLEFSKKLNRIISLGSKATIENYIEMFKFSPDLLIQRMHASGIFRYDETINDMDMFSFYKWTTKGPHSAGAKNKNSVGITYRGLHPSFIGYIDMTVCGNSDPGTSGTLSPYSDMKGFYFDDSDEPDNYKFDFIKRTRELLREDGVESIVINFETKEDYYRLLKEMREFTENNVKVSYTSRIKEYEVVLEEEEDMEEKTRANK